MSRALFVRDAEVDGRRTQLRVDGGRIVAMGTDLAPSPTDEVIWAGGGAVLPGLVDHHLHLFALAVAEHSVLCGPPEVTDVDTLAEALGRASTDRHGWVRGVGYHESVAGELDADLLDRLHPDRPVRVQHRSGALWVVNSLAARLLGLAGATHPGIERDRDGRPTGRLWRADEWLRTRLPAAPPDLEAVGARLAALGITAVTDATPDLDTAAITAIADAVRCGALPQRVHLLGAPIDAELSDGLTAGPYKIVLADSGLPAFDELVERIRTAHAAGRAVAAHCVTREALVLVLAALDEAGHHPGDRIEHAAVVPEELLTALARHRLRVVTQPGFLAHRGDDYLRDVPEVDHPDLYRCRSLLAAGVPLALSSDAPYGPLDPWAVIAAAVRRRTPGGAVVGPAERLAAREALRAYLAPPSDPGGAPRAVRPGAPADLVLLDRPLATVLADPRADAVRGVVIDGRWIPR